MTEATDNEPMCAICREDSVCDFVTRCGHYFHESCLNRTRNRSTCPYCSRKIGSSKFFERIMFKTRHFDEELRDEIYSILSSLTRVDPSTGQPKRSSKVAAFNKLVLEVLTKIGWDINSPDEGGHKMLEWVCQRDDLYRLNLLFEYGLRLDNNSELRNWALEIAREECSNIVASRIQDCSSVIRNENNWNSPLHVAVSRNDLNAIKNLIAEGGDVNARNVNGVTPLHLAASEANLEIVSYLIDNGARIDCHDLSGYNALYEACRSAKHNNAAVVSKLLEAGAKVDFLDKDKNTLLHCVLISKRFDIAELLIASCSDINQLNVYEESCIHLAINYGPKSLLEKMIVAGADVNRTDSKGQSPLHKALLTNNIEVVELLLQKGANVNAPNGNGEYPIHLALRRIPSLPFVKVLSRHGADLTVKDQKGFNIVELALESRY